MSSGGRDAILARIRGTTENVALNSADFVIEAAAENYDLKAKILKQVDSLVRPEAIIASNSSSVSITKLAAVVSRSDHCIGMHFFNPVPVMALVGALYDFRHYVRGPRRHARPTALRSIPRLRQRRLCRVRRVA